MIRLTDEEIDYEIKYVYEHNDLPLEVLLKPLIQSANKAQLKKVFEAVDKVYDEPDEHLALAYLHKALLEEVKE